MRLPIFLSVLFIEFALLSCESVLKDDIDNFCVEVGSFCVEVDNLNFTEVEIKIETYLDCVSKYHFQTDIYYQIEILKLKEWLLKRSCVVEVTLQPGIIETLPPIKELDITFNNTDSTFIKTLDIILDSNLNVRFH